MPAQYMESARASDTRAPDPHDWRGRDSLRALAHTHFTHDPWHFLSRSHGVRPHWLPHRLRRSRTLGSPRPGRPTRHVPPLWRISSSRLVPPAAGGGCDWAAEFGVLLTLAPPGVDPEVLSSRNALFACGRFDGNITERL